MVSLRVCTQCGVIHVSWADTIPSFVDCKMANDGCCGRFASRSNWRLLDLSGSRGPPRVTMAQSNGIASPQNKEKTAIGKRKRGDVAGEVDKKSQSVAENDRTPGHQIHSPQDFLIDILEILQRQADTTTPR